MQLFDRYSRTARLLPGLLAVLPLLVFAAILLPSLPLAAIATLATTTGVTFALAVLARNLGLSQERRLLIKWGGWPTTHYLRHRTARESPQIVQRQRRALEQFLEEPLPAEAVERVDPKAADQAYIAATHALKAHIRERTADFPRVFEESIGYGFARNMLGLKPIALSLVGIGIAGDFFAFLLHKQPAAVLVVVGLHLGMAAYWFFAVRDEWVHRAGWKYAERLFETVDTPHFRGGQFTPTHPTQPKSDSEDMH